MCGRRRSICGGWGGRLLGVRPSEPLLSVTLSEGCRARWARHAGITVRRCGRGLYCAAYGGSSVTSRYPPPRGYPSRNAWKAVVQHWAESHRIPVVSAFRGVFLSYCQTCTDGGPVSFGAGARLSPHCGDFCCSWCCSAKDKRETQESELERLAGCPALCPRPLL